MCQSTDHGIDKCPEFLAVKAAKAKAAPVGFPGVPDAGAATTVPPVLPAVAQLAVVGRDEELQQMLNNARA
jgi:hypothetical protein